MLDLLSRRLVCEQNLTRPVYGSSFELSLYRKNLANQTVSADPATVGKHSAPRDSRTGLQSTISVESKGEPPSH